MGLGSGAKSAEGIGGRSVGGAQRAGRGRCGKTADFAFTTRFSTGWALSACRLNGLRGQCIECKLMGRRLWIVLYGIEYTLTYILCLLPWYGF